MLMPLLLWFCTVELLIFKCSLKHFSLVSLSLALRIWVCDFVSLAEIFHSWSQFHQSIYCIFLSCIVFFHLWFLNLKHFLCVFCFLWKVMLFVAAAHCEYDLPIHAMQQKEWKWNEKSKIITIIIVVRLFLLLFHSFRLITIIITWMDEKKSMLESVGFFKNEENRICAKDNRQNARTQYTHMHTHIAQTHPFNIYRIKNRKTSLLWK